MILRHLEGIGRIKKFGFKFILFFLIASPIIASETIISERPDFENLVKDKKLDSFKAYKVWFLIFFILSLSSITAFIFKKQLNFLSNFITLL